MKYILLFIIFMSSNVTHSQEVGFEELKHIKLSAQFKNKIRPLRNEKSKSAPTEEVWKRDLVQALFGDEALNASKLNSNKADIPVLDEPLIYQTIRAFLGESYQQIGQTETQRLNQLNQQFNLGTQNFSGFTWQKPFGGIYLHVDRQLSPDLFDQKRWIVQDTFSINIEASSFLGRLNEAGVVEMTNSEIAAYAGIQFKRTFYSYQYAETYMKGLIADFTFLFLPFLRMTPQGILDLPPGHLMKREDNWTVGIGAILESPSYYGFSFSGGVLSQLTHQARTTVQKLLPEEAVTAGEALRVSHESQKAISVGVAGSLQVDLFKFLKLTLFSGEFNYESQSGKEWQLSFKQDDINAILANDSLKKEFKNMIQKTHPEIKDLMPYTVRLDEQIKKQTKSSLNLFLYSILNKKDLEQIRMVKNNEIKLFFRSYSESIRIIQNFISKIISSVFYGILKFNWAIKNDAQFSKKITIEYEANSPQSADPQKMLIEKSEQFSMNIQFTFEAARTHKWVHRKYKKNIIDFMDKFAHIDPAHRNAFIADQLRGPAQLQTNYKINYEGLDNFNQKDINHVFQSLAEICESKRVSAWSQEANRIRMLSKPQVGKELCVKNLGKVYLKYKNDLIKNKSINLAYFQKFMQLVVKKIKHSQYLSSLFGEYLFIHGQFQASTENNIPFFTHYKSGQFRGLGVIDTYKRQSGTGVPISIFAE